MKASALLPRLLAALSLAAIAALLAACGHAPLLGPQRFTVLHSNDHHGHFWRNTLGEGGLAARKTLIDAVRAELEAAGEGLLLLDGGDVNTGTPESDLLLAEPDFRGMSRLGYQAMVVGNHEFDRSPAVLERQRREWSNFPWLSANVHRGGTPVFEPYRLFTLGALRIAVLGLTSEETLRMGVAERHPGLEIEPALSAAARWVPRLRRDARADMVIALTHLGHDADGRYGSAAPGDVSLARQVSGIDLIVGGHSHHLVCMLQVNQRAQVWTPGSACAPDRQNGTWIVQAGDRGRFLGRADFEWRGGRLELLRYRLLPVNLRGTDRVAEDPALQSWLEGYRERAAQGLAEPVGHARGRFDGERASVRQRRTALGMLLTQAMREAGRADCALISSGGLRASLPDGALTQRDLLSTLPFGNRLVVVTMSGEELLAYLQTARRFSPGSGAFAQYSGCEWVEESELRIGDQALRWQQPYRLALPSFVAQGGDGYPDLRAHPGYADLGIVDHALLRAFIAARGTIDAAAFEPPR